MEKEILIQYIEEGKTVKEIAALAGKGYSSVRYWLKRYGLKTLYAQNKRTSWTDEELTQAVRECRYMCDVLKRLGLTVRPGNYETVRAHIGRLNLDTSHFLKNKGSRGHTPLVPYEELFCEKCQHARHIVKNRLIKEKLLPYRCAICGIVEWRGEQLSLVLDHINGVNNDNRLENLRFLCPNCNAQQPTFCRGKAL